jgi:MFS transporter, SP family, sugar:H+ symporter
VDTEGANWGYSTAFLFLGTGIVTCVVAYFYVPEPSQRNSAEMDEMYEKKVPARHMRKYVTQAQTRRGLPGQEGVEGSRRCCKDAI